LAEASRGVSREGRGGFGIFKPGRGYWVRMMTALGLGILFLSTAGWAWQQLDRVALPMKAWALTLEGKSGELNQGDSVNLFRLDLNQTTRAQEAVRIGSGVVVGKHSEGRGTAIVDIGQVRLEADTSMQDARRVEAAVGAAGSPSATLAFAGIARAEGIPIFERTYLKAGVALAIILVGCVIIYRFVGVKQQSVDFLIATDEEMRKVNWSTRQMILNSTYVVVFATFFIAAYIFVWDWGLQWVLLRQILGS
jgi:preprotein translocase SecE subunit